MAENQREIKVTQSEFDGIDRSRSSNDADNKSARVLRDMVVTPEGRLKLRDEYANLYDYRPSQYEHTTNDSSDERLVFDAPATHKIYRSHGRKCVVRYVKSNVEYAIIGYVEEEDTPNTHTLYLQRATRSGLDFTVSANRLTVVATPAQAGFADDWIEFSMVIDVTGDNLHVITTVHDDTGGTTVVGIRAISGLTNANFSTATVGATTTIQSDNTITRDLDLDIDGSRVITGFWGLNTAGVLSIQYADSADWGTIANMNNTPNNYFGISCAVDPNDTTSIYLCYHDDTGTNTIKVQKFLAGVLTDAAVTMSDTAPYKGADTAFYYRALFNIDTDGTQHLVYRTAAQQLVHVVGVGGSATAITADLSEPSGAEDVSTHTGWDFVVKDGIVTVFYTTDTNKNGIYKRVLITDGDDDNYNAGVFWTAELVETAGATETYMCYFDCFDKYEVSTSKRFSYVLGTSFELDMEVKYLHSDKGFYDADNDGSIADTGSIQTQIESLAEPLMSDSDGSTSQIMVIQCSDDRLYKRGDYQWVLLEGSRLVDNSGWNWVTVFEQPAEFRVLNGVLRANAGSEATSQNVWYGYIDRDYFIRGADADTNATTRYNDHYSDLQRLPTPSAAIVTSATMPIHTDAPDGYTLFTQEVGGRYKSTVFSSYSPQHFDIASVSSITCRFGISFEYDGYQESQILVFNNNIQLGTSAEGDVLVERTLSIFRLVLDLNDWNISASPLNARITAIIVHMATVNSDSEYNNSMFCNYERVKRIQVSRNKSTGNYVFGTDVESDIKGERAWTDDGDGTFSLTTYIDYDHYANRTPSVDSVGNRLPLYDSTASGTEIYTQKTFIPEGYAHSVVVNNEVWVGDIRLAGVSRSNRLMRSARRLGNQVSPDHLSSTIGTFADLEGSILGLSKIGDDILVASTSHGIESFDIRNGMLNRIDNLGNVGCNARLSVTEVNEGGIGTLIRGVVYKDYLGRVRIFDGAGAPIIDAPIRDNWDASNKGTVGLNSTSAVFLYLPHYRKLILGYPNGTGMQLFVKDFESDGKWYDWRFTDEIDYACVGVDGEMFFTDGDVVYQYPKAGSDDVLDPIWVGKDNAVPNGYRGLIRKVWMDYLYISSDNSDILLPGCYKDRAITGSRTNATHALAECTAISSTQTRDRTGFTKANAPFSREVALEFHVSDTSLLTSLEVDMIEALIQLEKRRTD